MAETLRELAVALSLDFSNCSRNLRTINAQNKEAGSAFRPAGIGMENLNTGKAEIYIIMLVFCEKWNIIQLESANEVVSWCREPMIRDVVVKGCCYVQKTARSWRISVHWVAQYALEGIIPGAERFGGSWAIPEDASKPEKHRSGPKPKEAAGRTNR